MDPTNSESQTPSPEADFDAAIAEGRQQVEMRPDQIAQAAAAKAKEQAQPEKPTEEAKAPVKAQTPLEKLKGTEAAEEKKPDTVVEEPEMPKGMKPEAQDKWKELKLAKAERDQLKPKFEALQKEHEALKAKPPAPDEATVKELEELRQWRAAEDVKSTPEFQQAVAVPIQAKWQELKDMAEHAGVDYDALLKATDIANKYQRNEAIEKVLRTGEKEISSGVLAEAFDAARELHKLYAEGEKREASARELKNAINGRKTQETAAQAQEREQKWNQASDEIFKIMVANPVIGDLTKGEMAEVLKSAKLPEDPMDQAMAAQAYHMLPVVAQALKDAKTQIAALERAAAARVKAKPAISQPGDTPVGEKVLDLDDAIRQSFPGHR